MEDRVQVRQLLAADVSVSGLSYLNFLSACETSRVAVSLSAPSTSLGRRWNPVLSKAGVARGAVQMPYRGRGHGLCLSFNENDVASCEINTFYIATIHERNSSVKHTNDPSGEPYSLARSSGS